MKDFRSIPKDYTTVNGHLCAVPPAPETEFALDWPHGHQTRKGLPVRILSSDRKHPDRPIVAAICGRDGIEHIRDYRETGRYCWGGQNEYDLINVEAPSAERVAA